jgi:multicomponent Na+:H+ antiporter subunit G
VIELVSCALVLVGVVFFVAGTAGLLRFPDVYTRLHALTKADNVGLGCVVAGLALHAGSPAVALKLVLVWLLAMVASATSCHLVARAALRAGVVPLGTPPAPPPDVA